MSEGTQAGGRGWVKVMQDRQGDCGTERCKEKTWWGVEEPWGTWNRKGTATGKEKKERNRKHKEDYSVYSDCTRDHSQFSRVMNPVTSTKWVFP